MSKSVLRFLGSDRTRIGSGLAAYIAMALFLWPPEFEGSPTSIDLALLIAALVAFFTWGAAELRHLNPPLSSHDLGLYQKIKDKITDSHIYFLRTHDLGGGRFLGSMVNIYPEIVHTWLGARWEFNDRALQSKWATVRDRMDNFSEVIGPNLHADGRECEFLSMERSDRHVGEGRKRFERERSALNDAATAVASALDDFDRTALPKVPAPVDPEISE